MKKPRKVSYYRQLSKSKVKRVVTAATLRDITPEEAAEMIEKIYYSE